VSGSRADTLGVLGGMGPLATADFMKKLIELTPAKAEVDHIPLIVLSANDIPDRVAPILTGEGPSPLPALLDRRHILERAGARAFAMPCNTAHHWERELVEDSPIPFISIVDAALTAVAGRLGSGGAVGVIGTAATLRSGFYQRRLVEAGYDVVLPRPDVLIEAIVPGIALVKKNRIAEAEPLFQTALEALLDQGADCVLLACTEVDMALPCDDSRARQASIDTNEALALACIDWALAQRVATA
jgi:aspartate racemase